MTHQHDTLVQLELEYHHVTVRDAGDGSGSIYADCFDRNPQRCVVCGEPDDIHEQVWHGHAFRVAMPVATYRVSPSGFRQLVGAEAVVA